MVTTADARLILPVVNSLLRKCSFFVDARLREFPESGRNVYVVPWDSVVTRGLDISDALAWFNRKTGNVYVTEEGVTHVHDNLRQVTNGRLHISLEQLALVSMVFHEGIHRSCVTRKQPKRIKGMYVETIQQFFTDHKERFPDPENLRIYSHGLTLEVLDDRKRFGFGTDLDELVTKYFSSLGIMFFLLSHGYPSNSVVGDTLSFSDIFPETSDEVYNNYIDSIQAIQELSPEQFNRFYSDFFTGKIPSTLYRKVLESLKLGDKEGISALACHVLDSVLLFPRLLDVCYKR